MALILRERDLEGHGSMRTMWCYNCMDCAITAEVADAILPLVEADPLDKRMYEFLLAQQSPAFAMAMRGVAISEEARAEAIKGQEEIEREAIAALQTIVAPYWTETEKRTGKCQEGKLHKWEKNSTSLSELGELTCGRCGISQMIPKPFNPHSHVQCRKLLYDLMNLKPQKNKSHKVSTDDECLSRIVRKFNKHAPIVEAILEARGARKQLGLLRSILDADGRWRSSVNVGAAVTGRYSSSKSAFWTGGNIQNVADRSRRMFVADPGLVLFYADYEKAESEVVAYDAQDEAYISAHGLGKDLHTEVAKLFWPGVVSDRSSAETHPPWDSNLGYRDYAKHIGHGSAIGMSPHGIARDAHIKLAHAKEYQQIFFARHPRIRARQNEIWAEVVETGQLVSPVGRRRTFLGRLIGDGARDTRREALAQTQQSMIVDWVGVALCRIWEELDGSVELGVVPHNGQPNRAWLLAQVHDAVLGMVRWGDDVALGRILHLMSFGMGIRGRRMVIPVEILVGRSWKKSEMWKWKPGQSWPKEGEIA
jgi:DNA polymerase I-like protein with 3'-5' exonuclease and polymerase domains